MDSDVEVSIEHESWNALDFDPAVLSKDIIAQALIAAKGDGVVSLLLTSDVEIQILNRDFRQKDKPTNVLSFPMNDDGVLGDIAIAFETTEREAKAMGVSFHDHYIHLLIHGTLHLLGHDHENDAEAEDMEALEVKILEKLGVKNPYLNPHFMA